MKVTVGFERLPGHWEIFKVCTVGNESHVKLLCTCTKAETFYLLMRLLQGKL